MLNWRFERYFSVAHAPNHMATLAYLHSMVSIESKQAAGVDRLLELRLRDCALYEAGRLLRIDSVHHAYVGRFCPD